MPTEPTPSTAREDVERLAKRPYTGRTLRSSTTGVRGVSFNAAMRKYRAAIQVNGQRRYLGAFDTVEEAARAYMAAAGAPREGQHGYKYRYVNGRSVREHRLIWEAANGPIPEGMHIDHIDGDPTNNALGNLRLASPAQNQWNKGAMPGGRLGVKGVNLVPSTGRYTARIKKHGRQYHLGTFDTIERAAAAYTEAARRLHGEFARAALAQKEG